MYKKRAVKLGLIFAISTSLFTIHAKAAVNPTNLVQSGYWYVDEDIRTVIKNRVNEDNVYIAPALPFQSGDLVRDIVQAAVVEARTKGTALIPINFNNNHWASLAIRRANDGSIKVIYNDSLGGSLSSRSNSALLLQTLRAIDPTIVISDLQIRQQSDGSSCGAFTAENLIKLAEIDVSSLSEQQIREVLTSINDARAIRNAHFYLLYDGADIIDVEELKPKAKATISEIQTQNRQLIRNIINIGNFTHDRLNNLNRFSHFAGVAAGDGSDNYGVWIKGFKGDETDKGYIINGTSKNIIGSKSDLHGLIIGADSKIDEELTLGLAYSNISSKTKQKLSGIQTGTDKLTSNIFSAYGSGNFDENISLNGNVAYGQSVIKTTPTSANKSFKQKGRLFGGSLVANYKIYSSESLIIEPRFGGSYSNLLLKGYQNGAIKVDKTKQQQVDLNIGIALSAFCDTPLFTLMPEISGEYSHSVWNKGNQVKIRNLINQTILSQKINSNKGTFKLAANLSILTDLFEISGGYEHSIQQKSKTRSGHIKLRINF